MANAGSRAKEERKCPRKPLEDKALLMILTGAVDVLERACVQDISKHGICFNNVEPIKGFNKDKDRVGPDQTVMAYFENHPLSLIGTLKRIDDASGRMALYVKRSSDQELWESLCRPEK
jgi:hypothetical protein